MKQVDKKTSSDPRTLKSKLINPKQPSSRERVEGQGGDSDTRAKLLEVALELVQTRGYNAFSFRDLADQVGIKTASIHYHFPTKKDLGLALVQQQRQILARVLSDFDAHPDPWERLKQYIGIYRATLHNGFRMCLCGMLAIENQTLPPDLVDEVRSFFEDNERWLARTLKSGKTQGLITYDESPGQVARALLAALEGALLVARVFGDFERFESAAHWNLKHLQPIAPTARKSVR